MISGSFTPPLRCTVFRIIKRLAFLLIGNSTQVCGGARARVAWMGKLWGKKAHKGRVKVCVGPEEWEERGETGKVRFSYLKPRRSALWRPACRLHPSPPTSGAENVASVPKRPPVHNGKSSAYHGWENESELRRMLNDSQLGGGRTASIHKARGAWCYIGGIRHINHDILWCKAQGWWWCRWRCLPCDFLPNKHLHQKKQCPRDYYIRVILCWVEINEGLPN